MKVFKIDAVHPILKRVVKFNMTKEEMLKFYKELEEAGYEGENIELTPYEIKKRKYGLYERIGL